MQVPRRGRWIARTRTVTCLAVLTAAALLSETAPLAFNYVIDSNGTYWGIQDDGSPRVDTGSIRATQIAPGGQTGAYSTSINGFGGIRVLVETPREPYLNGELMRGFGLEFDGVNRFHSTQSVDMAGVTVSRTVYVNTDANWGRWLDTFTNTTKRPITIRVAFGGQSGQGTAGPNSSEIVATSSGDTVVTPEDAWVEYATPLAGPTLVGGPQVTVLGTPRPFKGAMSFAGNWLHDTFETPLAYSGHERNFQAYVNTITLPPRTSRSLLHFVVLGQRVDEATSAAERAAVEATATALAMSPPIDDLSAAEICSVANFDLEALSAPELRRSSCHRRRTVTVDQPRVPRRHGEHTAVKYDVVEKTIAQLQADMERRIVTSQGITRAYLDRIDYYDRGPLGFHAYEIVANDAMAQARAADKARRSGASGPLLGIPIIIKNNYDTFDMATTNGSFTFEGFQPAHDAFQVARLREAGAVIIGKGALEEYATFGHWSNDAWGQVWSVFNPSRSPLASSGGSASAVAGSFAAAGMGSQTGDSLYAPASAQSLVTLRGTDGLGSGTGIQPLVWMVDFGGALTRTVSDLADILNVVTGIDPDDPATGARPPGAVPGDWRSVLDLEALRGKRIGFVDAAWADVFGSPTPPFDTNGTIDAMRNALRHLEEAGATIVPMGQLATPPTPDAPPAPAQPIAAARVRAEGWRQYIDSHPELAEQGFSIFTEVDVDCSQQKVIYTRFDPSTCAAELPRLTADEIQQMRDYRQIIRPAGVKQWMDDAVVDAVVYPGLLSDTSLNDGGGGFGKAAFGRRDTPSAGNGVPTIAMPAGMNDRGQPVNIQLMGRAWDDARLVAFAYAFEHYATLAGNGHQIQRTAPALPRDRGKGRDDDKHDKDDDRDRKQ
ncbi:MAG: amidase [Acidobacteria bacterium]|nr:amidase [Acidobacteriota bacterium]